MYCRWSQEGGNDAANSDWPDQIASPPPPDSISLLAGQHFDKYHCLMWYQHYQTYCRQIVLLLLKKAQREDRWKKL